MSGAAAIGYGTTAALALLLLAMLLTLVRLGRGPTLADRILALDLLTTLAIGFIGVVAIRSGFALYVDIALGVALVGFLSTIALTRYLMRRAAGQRPAGGEAPE